VPPREVKISDLEEFYDSLARNLMKDHEKRFWERARSVKDAANGLGSAAGRLSVGVKNSWGTLDKQTSEYSMRLAQTLQDNSQTLAAKEPQRDFHATEAFHQEAVKVLNEIILTVRKYVPKIPKTLRLEMTILNSALTKLERAVKDLGDALDASPGLKLDSLHRDVEGILRKSAELIELRSEQQTVEKSLGEAEGLEKQLASERDSLISTSEFLELRDYEDSLKHKADEIRQFLQPLSKPLLKLERARATKKGEALDIKTLHDLVENPLETVVAGQLFATNELLTSLESALSSGELDLEERKRRKAEEVINSVQLKELEKMRSEYMALQANTQESLRQLKSKGLLDKKEAAEGQIAQTHSHIELIRGKQRELQRRNDEIARALSKLKGSIESNVMKAARQTIHLSTDE
jgi:hypothetical protein